MKYLIILSISYLFSMISLFFPVLTANKKKNKIHAFFRFPLQGISIILNIVTCVFLYFDKIYLFFAFMVVGIILAIISYTILLIKTITNAKQIETFLDGPHDKETNKSYKEVYCFSIALVLITLIYMIYIYCQGVL